MVFPNKRNNRFSSRAPSWHSPRFALSLVKVAATLYYSIMVTKDIARSMSINDRIPKIFPERSPQKKNGSYPPPFCRPVSGHQRIKEAWHGVKAFRGDLFSKDY